MIVAFVSLLFYIGHPAAIIWRIATIIIYTVECQVVGVAIL